MKNKKGIVQATLLWFILIVIILGVIGFFSGGIAISSILQKIPKPVWVIIGIILLFKLIGRKK